MLEALFRSRVVVKLIAYFLKHPDEEVYLREISREVAEPASAVRRDLKRLEAIGFLSSRKYGNHKYFAVRQDFPIFPELKSLFLKTEGAVEFLREGLAKYKDIQLAFAYGAFAERPLASINEIELVIVGSVNGSKLDNLIENLQKKLGRKIYCTHYTPDRFRYLLEKKDPSLEAVLDGEKLVLVANVNQN
ncbi:MAG: winged helix-turn-helix domain-containing protein [Firmicutes bacterium]|nr:winged helix-turn-helix domain-containing protein [Bacillota bacterium]